ncbi:MAG: hypothetical protein ACI308_08520 [Muribaculaceae bacterium]
MIKLQHILSLLTVLTLLCTTGCIEDSFTTSSSDLLEFSCDTLAFDTIFTELGTPTKQFVVYNRHKKQIKISEITLQGNAQGRFYINVDGMKGEEFHDVTIRGEDSIYVFVESRINATGNNAPLRVEDCINFVTNNVTQKVVLTAWGQDVERLTATTFDGDAHLTAQKPYVIFDTLRVEAGATLTIDAGATLYFHDKAAMCINGSLLALGTQQNPITLRGDRTDYLFDGANYDIMSGQWGGLFFGEESSGNEMQYVLMRGSTDGLVINSASTQQCSLHLFNSVLHNSSNTVMQCTGSWIEAQGCEFSNAAQNVVSISGGIAHFTQCTFANYYLFGTKGMAIINIDFTDDDGNDIEPEVSIDNSIISGNTSEFNIGDFTGHNVLVRSTLLRSSGNDDSNFINCVWGGDPKFRINRDIYVFDYRLGNQSDAIAVGDPELCPEEALTDRYGQPRIYNGAIDMGAYRWIEVPENQ